MTPKKTIREALQEAYDKLSKHEDATWMWDAMPLLDSVILIKNDDLRLMNYADDEMLYVWRLVKAAMEEDDV